MEKNLAEYGDILRPEDVQKILHVGRNTVYRYLAEGTIKLPDRFYLSRFSGGEGEDRIIWDEKSKKR